MKSESLLQIIKLESDVTTRQASNKHGELAAAAAAAAARPPEDTLINVYLLKMTGSSQPLYEPSTHLLVELCKLRT